MSSMGSTLTPLSTKLSSPTYPSIVPIVFEIVSDTLSSVASISKPPPVRDETFFMRVNRSS